MGACPSDHPRTRASNIIPAMSQQFIHSGQHTQHRGRRNRTRKTRIKSTGHAMFFPHSSALPKPTVVTRCCSANSSQSYLLHALRWLPHRLAPRGRCAVRCATCPTSLSTPPFPPTSTSTVDPRSCLPSLSTPRGSRSLWVSKTTLARATEPGCKYKASLSVCIPLIDVEFAVPSVP